MKSSFAPTKSIGRTTSVQKIKPAKTVILGKEKEKQKTVKSVNWDNIFDVSKARISFAPRDLDCNEMEYTNFYRTDGKVLSCHVTVRSIPSGDQARQDMLESTQSDERWAVLTVRSASSIGNANFIGVGLLGVDRISQTQLERAIGGESTSDGTALNFLIESLQMERE